MDGTPPKKKRRTPKKLTDEEKREIVRLHKTEIKSQRDLAHRFDASKSQIQRILNSVVNSDEDDRTISTLNAMNTSVGIDESIPSFSDFSDLTRFLKIDASDKPKDDRDSLGISQSNKILDDSEPQQFFEEIIQTENIREDTRSEEQKFKDYVLWYIDYVKEEKDTITTKYEQIKLELEEEKSKHQSLKAKMVVKGKVIADLMAENANLKKGLEEAKNREKEMPQRSSASEEKRKKPNVCVRCTSATIFEYQSLPFCSINCLKETAKSLQSAKGL